MCADQDKMKASFQTLVQQELTSPSDDERYLNLSNDASVALLLDVTKDDTLRKRELAEREKGEHHITTMAKLMAPMLEGSFSAGFVLCDYLCFHLYMFICLFCHVDDEKKFRFASFTGGWFSGSIGA